MEQAPLKGRGAVSNRDGRFEAFSHEPVDDGWERPEEEEGDPPLRTTLSVDSARRIIARNDSPDVPFDRSINPYRGCEHGCIYCFARPSHAYLGLSPGLDFESRLFWKPEGPALLERELRAPSYRPAPLALGANTDPYQPVERRQGLTRRILEVLERFNHPVMIITKSALVTRDRDILSRMAKRRLASVALSVTTLDRALARKLEPRAATPSRRIEAIRQLSAAGVPVSVLVSPVIPGLTDHEIEAILAAAAAAGAVSASTLLVRLPLEISDLFIEWLEAHAPDRKARVLSLIRQCRGGKLNEAAFGRRMMGQGPVAAMIRQRFDRQARALGLGPRGFALDCSQFRPPPAAGDQLALF